MTHHRSPITPLYSAIAERRLREVPVPEGARQSAVSAANAAGARGVVNVLDLNAADTRVFLFHGADAVSDPGGAMDKVNAWLGKDRAGTQYPNLKIRDIQVTSDGQGGVFTVVVVSLGVKSAAI